MHTAMAKGALFLLASLRGLPLASALHKLEKSQWWSGNQIEVYRNQNFSKLINHCANYVPFYREFFREAGIDSRKMTADELKFLPVISKTDLRQDMVRFMADGDSGRIEEAKTSGSTGIALHFPKSLNASAFQLAAMYRGHRWHGVEPGAKEARLWGVPVNRATRYKTRVKDLMLNRFREREYNLNQEILLGFCNNIMMRKPEYIMGYTSMVAQFAQFLEERGIDGTVYGLKMVKCTSETVTQEHRAIVGRVFGCPLVSEYGAAETGLIAFECEKGSMHIMSDCCIVELLDQKDDSCDGNLKEVVVTNLHNYAMPIVRYRVGDFAISSDRNCECGRVFPVLDNVIGRVANVIKSEDGRRWHSIILYYIMKGLDERGGGVVQFRVRQTTIDRLEFDLVPDTNFGPHVIEYLTQQCARTFGANMKVSFATVRNIERDASGKLRDFVSMLPS